MFYLSTYKMRFSPNPLVVRRTYLIYPDQPTVHTAAIDNNDDNNDDTLYIF